MAFAEVPNRIRHLVFEPHRVRRIRRYWRYRQAQRQLALIRDEIEQGRAMLTSRPVYMNLEPGPVCNLRCKFCCTANGVSTLKRELLFPDTFQRIVRHLPMDSLYEVNLFNWGEPFLNPHLLEYIRYFAERGLHVVIHTNFSAREYDDAFMKEVVRSGLGHLAASVDGASQEVYEKYRVGGNFDRVIRNMERLARARRTLDSDSPRISYKMLLHRYNQHEVEQARKLAESLQVEFWLQENFGVGAEDREEWTADSVRDRYGLSPITSVDKGSGNRVTTECRQLWDTLVINANGDVFPCCIVCTPESAVGNLAEQPFDNIWNNEKMQYLRRYVYDTSVSPPEFANTCAYCAFRSCTYVRPPS